MKEMREEVGTNACIVKKKIYFVMVTMSRLKRDFQWAIVGKIVKSRKKVD